MDPPLTLNCGQSYLWNSDDERGCLPFASVEGDEKPTTAPKKGPFRDSWAYLTEWFALSADVGRGVRR